MVCVTSIADLDQQFLDIFSLERSLLLNTFTNVVFVFFCKKLKKLWCGPTDCSRSCRFPHSVDTHKPYTGFESSRLVRLESQKRIRSTRVATRLDFWKPWCWPQDEGISRDSHSNSELGNLRDVRRGQCPAAKEHLPTRNLRDRCIC